MLIARVVVAASAVVGVATSLAAAQADVTLTLERALAEALARNPTLAVERHGLGIAAGGLRQARVYPLNPEVAIEGGAGTGRGREATDRRDINTMSVGLTQTVLLRGQWRLRVRAAEAGVARATAVVEDAERHVVGEVLRAFSDVRVGQERVVLADGVATFSGQVLDAARKLLDAGAVPALDAFRAQADLERARNRLLTEARNLATSQRELALLVGRDARATVRAEGPVTFTPPAGDPAMLQREALDRRPDLAAARAAVRAARAELELVGAERFFPEVKIGVRYDEGRDFDADSRNGLLTVSIPLPLFNRRQGDLERARAELRQQEAQVTLVTRRIEQEVASAYQRVQASARITEAYTSRILPEQDRTYQLLREGYDLGQFGLTDVFVGQRDFVDARQAYLAAVAELNMAAFECPVRIEEATAALEKAGAAFDRAKAGARAAARGALTKAKEILAHAGAEHRGAGASVWKHAEAVREARTAQGYAEEARIIAERF